MYKNSAINNILRRLFGNLGSSQKSTTDLNLNDEKWQIFDPNQPQMKDKINDIIKRYNLKCEKTEMNIEGEKFILENWKTDDGQMIIQRAYPADPNHRSINTGILDDNSFVVPEPQHNLDGLNELLNQSIQDERYEDAAKYRDLIKNFK